ncbi:3-isopropylmalate dehydrogenase [Candidatus Methylospira mobilis]|uniref:3-isopropylmalate dehydrogenase n=1 Tax=Candidatus Methylospira mobilis TaxID=1808979 RepID=UPI0028F0904A|nr:3-isopropylmalate dehydrogenase [Candidatus Methylospira mobilis]WNV03470.1 3-isopropylmalate dehydrogenase [Candidatus Methylospira mobilis]
MTKKIAILPGDGIGPEIVNETIKVLDALRSGFGLNVETEQGLIGGAAYDATGTPFPEATLKLAQDADAILLGAVGGPKWEPLDYALRPERGLLGLRAGLELFANLRPALLYPQLLDASTLKADVVSNLDLMIIRELTGGIYFGKPRGRRINDSNKREGYNTLVYSESEISRIAHIGFQIARKRQKRLCSIDKANVLECTELWREVVIEVGKEYPDVALSHMYVDNAAMQLVRNPKQFDVMLTDNLFGDILSDCAAMLTGSIGMLPSASLDKNGKGMYEPIHGSAPDIAGRNVANPIATVLSLAMLLRYSFDDDATATHIEQAIQAALDAGCRTADIYSEGTRKVSTTEMGDAIVSALLARKS